MPSFEQKYVDENGNSLTQQKKVHGHKCCVIIQPLRFKSRTTGPVDHAFEAARVAQGVLLQPNGRSTHIKRKRIHTHNMGESFAHKNSSEKVQHGKAVTAHEQHRYGNETYHEARFESSLRYWSQSDRCHFAAHIRAFDFCELTHLIKLEIRKFAVRPTKPRAQRADFLCHAYW